MVALRVILEHQLPVRLHVVFDRARNGESRKVEALEASDERGERLFERLRILTLVDEEKSLPARDGHAHEREVLLVESLDRVAGLRANQSAVQRIRPRMVRA